MAATHITPLAKIDCHAHFVPDFYREALLKSGHDKPDGMPAPPRWDVNEHLGVMDQLNITRSILSISSPGSNIINGDYSAGNALARRCNDHAARIKKDHPTRFGFWALLPLPDTQASLDEIAYASSEEINADGFALETNYDGIYLGDEKFDAVFAELNRREAKVFIHPTTPCVSLNGSQGLLPGTKVNPLIQYPSPIFEFFFDTARTVANLFISGTIERYPNITYVIPHAGGALPPLINRFTVMAPVLNRTDASLPNSTPETFPAFVKDKLKTQFYFDTAGWSLPESVTALLNYVPLERLVYGSDYPWSQAPIVVQLSQAHDHHLPIMFPNPEDVEKIGTGNAKRLLGID